ncbi:MAG: 3'-5' exonuclease [Rhodobacterales bacterium]
MTQDTFEHYAILDFEASSLSLKSWPIEIGLSWIENSAVQTWSTLIRPDAIWDLDDWSPQSAAVHRIAFSNLAAAPSAQDVAKAFLKILAGRQLVSDAPEFETHWLTRLLHAAGTSEIPFIDNFDRISFALYSGYALDMVYETLERRLAPHRAGPDSARLANSWLKAARY